MVLETQNPVIKIYWPVSYIFSFVILLVSNIDVNE